MNKIVLEISRVNHLETDILRILGKDVQIVI